MHLPVSLRRPALAHLLLAGGVALVLAGTAHAAGSGMPWEEPLQKVLESVQGPVAKIVAVVIIITTGLSLAFGETSGGFRRLIQIVFGLSIAFAASSFFLSFFSFGGGALVSCSAPASISKASRRRSSGRSPSRFCSAARRAGWRSLTERSPPHSPSGSSSGWPG